MWESFSQWQELSGNTQYARVPWDKRGSGSSLARYNSGSGHATTSVTWLQYVLQYIVINTTLLIKINVSVFITFFSSFITKHNWHHNHHNHGRRWQKWPPSIPHEALCSAPMLWMAGWQPPKLADVFFEGLRVCMALEALLCSGNNASPQHWSVLRAIHTLNSPKKYIRLLRGLLPINSTHWRGARGLMWDARGTFLPVAGMVGYGCVGWCWLLEANVRSNYCRNSKNCLWKYFFISM